MTCIRIKGYYYWVFHVRNMFQGSLYCCVLIHSRATGVKLYRNTFLFWIIEITLVRFMVRLSYYCPQCQWRRISSKSWWGFAPSTFSFTFCLGAYDPYQQIKNYSFNGQFAFHKYLGIKFKLVNNCYSCWFWKLKAHSSKFLELFNFLSLWERGE